MRLGQGELESVHDGAVRSIFVYTVASYKLKSSTTVAQRWQSLTLEEKGVRGAISEGENEQKLTL